MWSVVVTSCGVCYGDLALRRMKGEIGQNIYNIIGQNSKQNLMNLPGGKKNTSAASCALTVSGQLKDASPMATSA